MDWTKLTSANNSYEADLLSGRLEQAGIGSRTTKGVDAPGAWLTGGENPFGPIDVYVPANQIDAARKLLPTATEVSADVRPSPPRTMQIVGAILVVLSVVAVLATVFNDVLS